MEGDYHLDVDGLLYLKPAGLKTYAAAKQHCERIPGHRLGIYKTMEQYQMLGNFTATTGDYCVCMHTSVRTDSSESVSHPFASCLRQ